MLDEDIINKTCSKLSKSVPSEKAFIACKILKFNSKQKTEVRYLVITDYHFYILKSNRIKRTKKFQWTEFKSCLNDTQNEIKINFINNRYLYIKDPRSDQIYSAIQNFYKLLDNKSFFYHPIIHFNRKLHKRHLTIQSEYFISQYIKSSQLSKQFLDIFINSISPKITELEIDSFNIKTVNLVNQNFNSKQMKSIIFSVHLVPDLVLIKPINFYQIEHLSFKNCEFCKHNKPILSQLISDYKSIEILFENCSFDFNVLFRVLQMFSSFNKISFTLYAIPDTKLLKLFFRIF
jgi:hypothetical protein